MHLFDLRVLNVKVKAGDRKRYEVLEAYGILIKVIWGAINEGELGTVKDGGFRRAPPE